jgi:hypothetical protein
MQAYYFVISVSKCFLLVVVAKHKCKKKCRHKCVQIFTLNSSLYLFWKREGIFSAHRRWLWKIITLFSGKTASSINRTEKTNKRLIAQCSKTIDRKTSLTETEENKAITAKGGSSGPCLYEGVKVFLSVEFTVTFVPYMWLTLHNDAKYCHRRIGRRSIKFH